MKWFKHLTSARRDERLAALIDDCGIEGYGFYFMLLEVVGESMDKGDRCELTYSLAQWSRQLYCHHHKVSKYLGKLDSNGLVEVTYHDGKVTVKIPKLLKHRDEYSKKSGQNPKKLRSKDKEGEGEKDTDTGAHARMHEAVGGGESPTPDHSTHPDQPLATLHGVWCELRGKVSASAHDLTAMRQALELPGATLDLVLSFVREAYRAADDRGDPPATFRYFLPGLERELQKRKLMATPIQERPPERSDGGFWDPNSPNFMKVS